LRKALPQISYYATTDKLKVFMSDSPGQRFTRTEDVAGFNVTVSGDHDGQAIIIHPEGHEFVVVGYRSQVSWKDSAFTWPEVKHMHVERVAWNQDHWERDGEPAYGVDQSSKVLSIDLDSPQAVRVTW